MKFVEIDIRRIDRKPPIGWKKTSYGYFQMEKVISQIKIQNDAKAHSVSQTSNIEKPLKGEGFIEQQFFFNILSSLKGHVNLIELGAGRGDWCLALAGIVDFHLIDSEISSYRCFAVEAEPTHYEWTKEHFESQNIKASAIHGAVSSKNGECRFYSVEDPAATYGQAIRDNGNLVVPCYTVDRLIEMSGFGSVEFMHVDIQGSECDMLSGAVESLSKGIIKYMMIGTHQQEFNKTISEFVQLYGYETLFSVPCRSNCVDTPFGKAAFPVDGVIVLKNARI